MPRYWPKIAGNRRKPKTDESILPIRRALLRATAGAGAGFVALAIAACHWSAPAHGCDPQALDAVRRARANRTEVTVCGTVARVDRVHRSRSGAHRTFFVTSGRNDRIEVDANLDVMGDFPVRPGQIAVVRGEYYADATGRAGVHWTHRTLRGSHPSGYIVLDGTTYQ